MIKKFALAFAALAMFAASANAGITGSHALTGGVTQTAGLNSLASVSATVFTGLGATGDFAPSIGAFQSIGGGTLTFAFGSPFTFGSATFGTFTGNVVVDDTSSANARTVYLIGNFAVGTYYNAFGNSTATVLFNFTQSGGPGNAISIGGTISTPAFSPPGVPEPATVASALVALGFIGVARLRRKTA